MKKIVCKLHAFALCVLLVTFPLVKASAVVIPPDDRFSSDELDQLLSPIALYPDPLLAQVIPAATFFDELEEANQVLGGRADDDAISNKNWDVSVKSVAHYPQLLQMMVKKSDWTATLGKAYVNQSTDVGKSIQRLRAEAKAAGNLATSPQQKVITDGQTIRIEPAQPQVIYVPQYDPQVVYVESGPSTGAVVAASAISFGVGLAMPQYNILRMGSYAPGSPQVEASRRSRGAPAQLSSPETRSTTPTRQPTALRSTTF